MSKELYFTDGNNEVKYLDTTASFNLAITQDGSAFDLTNATAIDVKVANDTGYVFDKSIDMATITQPLAGLITMPVDAEVMNALVPDDYTIEVWVTLSSLITPGIQEGLTDTSTDGATTDTTTTDTTTTATTTETTTYNAIFPSDDPQGFTITDNVMSDSGDVIPVMSLDAFKQEFDQLKTDLTNQVSALQGPAGKDGENGKDGATGPQGPQGIQGPKGDTGQGLEIKGKVDTTSQLPATASEGDGYLVAEELYIWTDNEWKDCGQIQGPAGKDGKDGATGPQGPKGDTGATGPQGPQGIQGLKGDTGATGATGPAGKDGTQVDLTEYAKTTDVTTAISAATANMVDSSKPTNFTAGLQLGGIDVATAADLKSIKDSAWRLMALPDQQASKNLSLLYQVDKVNKQLKINLSGTFGSITSDWAAGIVIADFGNIINGITSVDAYLTLIKLATDDSNAHFNAWNQGGTQNLTTNPTVNFTGSKLLIRCSDRAINSGYGRISVPTGEDFAMVNNTIQYDELV